jgi:hypothetical protein
LRDLPQAHGCKLRHLRPCRGSKFRWLGGDKTIRRYESAPGSFRSFCPTCGSLVRGQASYLATVSVPAGLLDADPGARPRLHVFTSSKAPW